jgi:hypothetical protein
MRISGRSSKLASLICPLTKSESSRLRVPVSIRRSNALQRDTSLLDQMASAQTAKFSFSTPAFENPYQPEPSTSAIQAPIPTLPRTNVNALFTPAERALLPNNPDLNPLDRKALKQKAKKNAKRAREAEKQERAADEDMFDASALFGSMSVTQPKRPELKKKKKSETKNVKTKGTVAPVKFDEETQKELDFMSFLNSVGGESSSI